jgi:hypothetical protein
VEGMEWTELAQNTKRRQDVLNAVMNLRASLNAGKFLISCKISQLLKRTLLYEVSKLQSKSVSQSVIFLTHV